MSPLQNKMNKEPYYNTKNQQNQDKKNLLELVFFISNTSPVAYNKYNTLIMGSTSGGVILSQLIYWVSACKTKTFYKKDEEIIKETFVSEWELRQAKATMKKMGIFDIEFKPINKNNKWYKTNHYTFNFEKYVEKLLEISKEETVENPVSEAWISQRRTCEILTSEPVKSSGHTDITTDITTNNINSLSGRKQEQANDNTSKQSISFKCFLCKNFIPLSIKSEKIKEFSTCLDCEEKALILLKERQKQKEEEKEKKYICRVCSKKFKKNEVFIEEGVVGICKHCYNPNFVDFNELSNPQRVRKKTNEILSSPSPPSQKPPSILPGDILTKLQKAKQQIGKSFFSSYRERTKFEEEIAKEERKLKK